MGQYHTPKYQIQVSITKKKQNQNCHIFMLVCAAIGYVHVVEKHDMQISAGRVKTFVFCHSILLYNSVQLSTSVRNYKPFKCCDKLML